MTRQVISAATAADPPTSRAVESGPLVGRAEELLRLTTALRTMPSTVLVGGEAGAGKSRLLNEALSDLDRKSITVASGRCQPAPVPFPYGVVLDCLRSCDQRLRACPPPSAVAGALNPLLPELADWLPAALPPLQDPAAEQHRLFRGIRDLLATLGRTVLVAEDLQWADSGSVRLLRFLTSNPPPGLSMVMTYRPEDLRRRKDIGGQALRPGHETDIVLRPLTPGQVAEMSRGLLDGRDLDEKFAALLHSYTAGTPRLVETLLDALNQHGWRPGDTREKAHELMRGLDIPSVRERTLDRLAALPTDARLLAEVIAVLGHPATVDIASAVAGMPTGRARVEVNRLLQAGVLVELDEYRYGYRDGLARQSVYRTLPGPRRQDLHRRAVRTLEKQDSRPLAQLAEHSKLGGQTDDWRRYSEELVDTALKVADVPAAIEILTSLFDRRLRGADLDRLVRRFCTIAPVGTDQQQLTGALETLLADPELSDERRSEVRLTYGLLLVRQEHGVEQGRAELESAVHELRDRPSEHLRGMAMLALPYLGSAPVAVHMRWVMRVEAAIDQCETGELRTALLANTLSSRVHLGHDNVESVLHELRLNPSDLDERRQLARLHCNLADAYSWVGHNNKSHQLINSAVHLATGSGAYAVVGNTEVTRLRLEWAAGMWDGLDARATDLITTYQGLHPLVVEACLVRGWLAVARGDWQDARKHLDRSGTAEPQDAIFPVRLAAVGATIRMLLEQGSHDAACAQADRAASDLVAKGSWPWAGEFVPYAVQAYVTAGRRQDARELTEKLAIAIDALNAPLADAALVSCRAELAHGHLGDAEVAELFEVTRDQHLQLGFRYRAAQLAERAAACRWSEDESGASAALSAVADQFEQMGATRDAARCRHRLRSHGILKPSSRNTQRYGEGLSPREREVARLVVAGHTNQEVADILFVSRRTVEEHVGNVLRKQGAKSRRELSLDGA